MWLPCVVVHRATSRHLDPEFAAAEVVVDKVDHDRRAVESGCEIHVVRPGWERGGARPGRDTVAFELHGVAEGPVGLDVSAPGDGIRVVVNAK